MEKLKKIWNQFGLTVVLFFMFLASFIGQLLSGFHAFNEERIEEHQEALKTVIEYLGHGHFISSVAENWESEFLQMMIFVVLTVFLFQKGSAESKPPPEERTGEDLKHYQSEEKFSQKQTKKHPILWRLYENSFSIALFMLFLISFLMHIYGHLMHENEKREALHQPLLHWIDVLESSKFWFESFQNWQSEFFSIAVLGLLSIYLRQKHSPQSKMLQQSAGKTGPS